ncbi:aldolase/citrate lyase family protein [Mesorhizobium prunaredense]|uniref:aldolase/citrate lyase family protein n=1 Tax=Mesorhizobium prunaredense TaxID=1631249 RepID=UPI002452ACDE|nr:aldolase/citrate lyase family protein [Mesorhizobium prunaredense]
MIKDTFPAAESALPLPRWRSLLFVPAHVPRFVETAHQRGADGLILDLEDSVPQEENAKHGASLLNPWQVCVAWAHRFWSA